jgi:hypothetical protein
MPINLTKGSVMLRIVIACAFILSTIIAAAAAEKGIASH